MLRKNIFILGAGMYAEEVADLVSDCGECQLAGFIDEFSTPGSQGVKLDKSVMTLEEASGYSETHLAICGVGGMKRIAFIRRALDKGFKFTSLIHPSAQVSKSATIGEGTTVRAGCVIAANVRIGMHVIINRGCLIGHHVEIGDYATIGPGVNIAGNTKIGNGTQLGIGAIVIEKVRIGNYAFVSAGSLVARDVPDRVQVVGMPAQIIREFGDNEEEE